MKNVARTLVLSALAFALAGAQVSFGKEPTAVGTGGAAATVDSDGTRAAPARLTLVA